MLEVLAVGEHSAGTLAEIAAAEFGTSRTTASYHLRTLREHGAVWSSVGAVEPRSRSYRLNPEFLAALDFAIGALVELWEQRYGTAEGRAPVAPLGAGRVHRFGEAERKRRAAALAGGCRTWTTRTTRLADRRVRWSVLFHRAGVAETLVWGSPHVRRIPRRCGGIDMRIEGSIDARGRSVGGDSQTVVVWGSPQVRRIPHEGDGLRLRSER